MTVMPAVFLGILVVFFVGAGLTYYLILSLMDAWRNHVTTKYLGWLTQKAVGALALIGGGAAVALLVLLLIITPKEWASAIWIGLTILGILGGLLTFLLNEPRPGVQKKARYRPPKSRRAPPTERDPYRELLARARQDHRLANRLIEYERERAPDASLDELCRRALTRWERDNR